MDDWGVPRDYRHMEGFGVHTFVLVNSQGRETLVKFHWKPTCGEAVTEAKEGWQGACVVQGWAWAGAGCPRPSSAGGLHAAGRRAWGALWCCVWLSVQQPASLAAFPFC